MERDVRAAGPVALACWSSAWGQGSARSCGAAASWAAAWWGVTALVVGVLLTSLLVRPAARGPAPTPWRRPSMGICLHFVYLTSRSLWLPILLHTLNNSLAVLSVRLRSSTAGTGDSAGRGDPARRCAIAAAAPAGSGRLGVYRSRARLDRRWTGAPRLAARLPRGGISRPPAAAPWWSVPGRAGWRRPPLVPLAVVVVRIAWRDGRSIARRVGSRRCARLVLHALRRRVRRGRARAPRHASGRQRRNSLPEPVVRRGIVRELTTRSLHLDITACTMSAGGDSLSGDPPRRRLRRRLPAHAGQRYTLGRATTNRIVLKDDLCSREHAEVYFADGRWRVRDLEQPQRHPRQRRSRSTANGSCRPGDEVHVGRTRSSCSSKTWTQLPELPRRGRRPSDGVCDQEAPGPDALPDAGAADDRRPTSDGEPAAPATRHSLSRDLSLLYRLALDMGSAATLRGAGPHRPRRPARGDPGRGRGHPDASRKAASWR